VSIDGAVFDVGRSEIWCVGGDRNIGLIRYNDGADTEAVIAVVFWKGTLKSETLELRRSKQSGTVGIERAEKCAERMVAFRKSTSTRKLLCRESVWLRAIMCLV